MLSLYQWYFWSLMNKFPHKQFRKVSMYVSMIEWIAASLPPHLLQLLSCLSPAFCHNISFDSLPATSCSNLLTQTFRNPYERQAKCKCCLNSFQPKTKHVKAGLERCSLALAFLPAMACAILPMASTASLDASRRWSDSNISCGHWKLAAAWHSLT